MNTRKKRKFKIHTGSVFKMSFIIAKIPLQGPKKFFKLCHVGTLNLCLKEPEKMQKTINQSDHPRQRKRPKTGQILPNSNFAIFRQFLGVFSAQSDWIHCIFLGSLRHKFKVSTRHTLKNFFWLFIGVSAILKGNLNTLTV